MIQTKCIVSICVWADIGLRRRVDTSKCEQNGQYFGDDTFKCIFDKKTLILINISLKFVTNDPFCHDLQFSWSNYGS